MFFRRSIPKKADIFVKSNNANSLSAYYKSFKNLKIVGIIVSSIVVLFGVAVFLVPGQQVSKAAQAMIACPLQTNGTVNGCNNMWWANQNWNGNGNNGNGENGADNNGDDRNGNDVNG